PGGSEAMARAHLARTGTRRVERLAWAWCRGDGCAGQGDGGAGQGDGCAGLATYLNRLSDAWFVFARLLDPGGEYTVYWRGASSERSPD
ncbi:MAG TPA: ATP:cob(I)alamin adenosyltransferase, partial [Halothiobacillaceae bacterium]|nr:ATP:cob(I)alamin adenosyltransferase [Halothiobacillaceae bacterium]